MSEAPIRIVTVSRQHGSGGGALARRLGEVLGWRVVGREIVQRIAAELRVSEEEVAAVDERVRGFIERIGIQLSGAFPELVPPPFPPARVDDETVRVLCEGVLDETVRLGPAVLVGHGGQCLFQDRRDALHLRAIADREARIERIRAMEGGRPREAAEEADARDHARAVYLRHHYGRAWDDPALYHLVIDLGRLRREEVVDAVAEIVRSRSGDG